jgi:hypothetical protein
LCPTHCSLHEVSVTFCKVNHTFLHVITIYYPCFDKQTNTALKTPLQPQHKVKSNDFLTLKLLNLTVTWSNMHKVTIIPFIFRRSMRHANGPCSWSIFNFSSYFFFF